MRAVGRTEAEPVGSVFVIVEVSVGVDAEPVPMPAEVRSQVVFADLAKVALEQVPAEEREERLLRGG